MESGGSDPEPADTATTSVSENGTHSTFNPAFTVIRGMLITPDPSFTTPAL